MAFILKKNVMTEIRLMETGVLRLALFKNTIVARVNQKMYLQSVFLWVEKYNSLLIG